MTRLAACKKQKAHGSYELQAFSTAAKLGKASPSIRRTIPGDPKAFRYSLTFSGETERMTKPLSRLDQNRFRSL